MKNIELIIWDLDGIHFKYDDAFDVQAYIASAKVAEQMIPGMDFDTAHDIATKSHKKSHASYKIFIEDYNLNPEQVMLSFHSHMDVSFMQPNLELQKAMRRMNVQHCILTAASEPWSRKLIQQLQLEEFFSNSNTITQEKCNYLSKAASSEPYIIALDKMGCLAENALMIEDTQKNLKYAKEIGIHTVWSHPNKNEHTEKFTDYVFNTPTDFANYFLHLRTA